MLSAREVILHSLCGEPTPGYWHSYITLPAYMSACLSVYMSACLPTWLHTHTVLAFFSFLCAWINIWLFGRGRKLKFRKGHQYIPSPLFWYKVHDVPLRRLGWLGAGHWKNRRFFLIEFLRPYSLYITIR